MHEWVHNKNEDDRKPLSVVKVRLSYYETGTGQTVDLY